MREDLNQDKELLKAEAKVENKDLKKLETNFKISKEILMIHLIRAPETMFVLLVKVLKLGKVIEV